MLGTDWTHSAAGGTWTFRLTDMARRSIADTAASQALETIRNRIDEFGVSEPIIARQGEDRILVQLPGIDDPKRVKDLIKNTAFLELKLVEGGPTPNRAELEARLTPDLELLEARA
jgi:preprotein translocase subunit SecD